MGNRPEELSIDPAFPEHLAVIEGGFCSERVVGHNPWAEAFVLCPAGATELSPGFQPWESSTKSDAPPGRGRQIERPNKAEAGFDGPIGARSQLRTLTFARQQVRVSSGTRISRPFSTSNPADRVSTGRYEVTPCEGEPFILRVPRVETLG